ncbi:MAG: SDR family NAD(P)-dependent oxidoreductase [Dehalococcoidia bacterium]
MGDKLRGKNAVVTGAGRGIGREIALALAQEGANVLVNDFGSTTPEGGELSRAPADEVVAEIKKLGVGAVANYDTVADFAAAEGMIRACVDSFGHIDILVNNAGIRRHRFLMDMTEEDWDIVIATHLKGAFNLCRHAVPMMREQGWGRIINITSRQWLRAEGMANYAAAKGGIVSLTYGLAFELGRYGITCNAVAPLALTRGLRNTLPRFKQLLEQGLVTEEHYQRLVNQAGPEFVPPIVVYLTSEYGAHVNGMVFHSDGGKISLFSASEEKRSIHKNHLRDGPWTLDELIELVPKTLLAE